MSVYIFFKGIIKRKACMKQQEIIILFPIKDVEEKGDYTVSFLKEKSEGFYVAKEVEELSYPVHRKELIVLSTPASQYRQRVLGFIFPKDVKETLMSFFRNQ